MKWIVVVALLQMPWTILTAQIPQNCKEFFGMPRPFFCSPTFIFESMNNEIVPGCSDSLVLCQGRPIPLPSKTSGVLVPAILTRDHGTNSTDFDTIDINYRIDPIEGTLTLYILEEIPKIDSLSRQPYQYWIQSNCGFWEGYEDEIEKLNFQHQHIIRSYSKTRLVSDSSEIVPSPLVEPRAVAPLHFIDKGVRIRANETMGNLEFDHWSCSDPSIIFDPLKSMQTVMGPCWPLLDTVFFTAWYRDVSTSVPDHHSQTVANVTWNEATSSLVIDGPNSPTSLITVYDVMGRVVTTQTNDRSGSYYVMPIDAQAGTYLLRLDYSNGSTSVHTFHISHSFRR